MPFGDGGFGRGRRGSCPRPATESSGRQKTAAHATGKSAAGRAGPLRRSWKAAPHNGRRVGEELFGYLGEAFPKPFLLPQHIPQTLITRRAFSRVHDYLGCGRVIVYLRDF